MAETSNNFAIKNQAEAAINLGDKNIEKIKNFKSSIQIILLVKIILMMMDHNII